MPTHPYVRSAVFMTHLLHCLYVAPLLHVMVINEACLNIGIYA